MQDLIIPINAPPSTTLSIDTQVYVGQNKIRRNVGTYTSLFIGTNVTDRVLKLAPGAVLNLLEPITTLVLRTDQPIELLINGTISLEIKSTLVLDQAITSLTLTAKADNANDANAHLTYLS
jgi:hypothetical protein